MIDFSRYTDEQLRDMRISYQDVARMLQEGFKPPNHSQIGHYAELAHLCQQEIDKREKESKS